MPSGDERTVPAADDVFKLGFIDLTGVVSREQKTHRGTATLHYRISSERGGKGDQRYVGESLARELINRFPDAERELMMGSEHFRRTDDPAIGIEQHGVGVGAARINAQPKRGFHHRISAHSTGCTKK